MTYLPGRFHFKEKLSFPGDGLDPDFGSGGMVLANFYGGDTLASSVAYQPDGKIVVTGVIGRPLAAARFNPDGTLDHLFGSMGVASVYFASTAGEAIGLQHNEKIVVAGSTGNGFILARYNSDGWLDSSFGSNGIATANFVCDSASICGMSIESNGKIVVAGTTIDEMWGNHTSPRGTVTPPTIILKPGVQ